MKYLAQNHFSWALFKITCQFHSPLPDSYGRKTKRANEHEDFAECNERKIIKNNRAPYGY